MNHFHFYDKAMHVRVGPEHRVRDGRCNIIERHTRAYAALVKGIDETNAGDFSFYDDAMQVIPDFQSVEFCRDLNDRGHCAHYYVCVDPRHAGVS